MKQIWKSIGAVAAGLVSIVILSNGTDVVLEATGVYPSFADQQTYGFRNTWMLLALGYRIAAAAVGGYLTAFLAPRRPRKHVAVLAGIGMAAGVAGIIVGIAADISPLWYAVSVAVLSLPAVLLGASLHRPKTTLTNGSAQMQ